MRALDADAVRALLPHTPPFLFVDDAPSVEPGQSATCRWTVPERTFWTDAHFPGAPVLPGVLLIEALAQACVVVVRTDPDVAPGLPALVAVDGFRLRAPVRPGDVVHLHSTAVTRGRLWRFVVRATVGDRLVAEGELAAVRASAPPGAAG